MCSGHALNSACEVVRLRSASIVLYQIQLFGMPQLLHVECPEASRA